MGTAAQIQRAMRNPIGMAGSKSSAIQRVTEWDPEKMIDYRRTLQRDPKNYMIIGKMWGITFDVSDGAQYEKAQQAHRPVRQRMLMLEWTENSSPVIAQAAGGQFLFPAGMFKPPRVVDQNINVIADPKKPAKELAQDMLDLADGFMQNMVTGKKFLVFQPVTSFVCREFGRLKQYKGYVDPATGTYPSLVYDPFTLEAHMIGGLIF